MITNLPKRTEQNKNSFHLKIPKSGKQSQSTFQFVDNRSETLFQRKLIRMFGNNQNDSNNVQLQHISNIQKKELFDPNRNKSQFLDFNKKPTDKVLQKAGDFTGLMLPHEKQQGAKSYTLDGKTFERNGVGKHELTYHHIIPEGKLVKLGNMVMRFEFLFGEENSYTDNLNNLKLELQDIEEELNDCKRDIRLGDEAEQKIIGLRRRQDPKAQQKAEDRGWNNDLLKRTDAQKRIDDIKAKLENKEREIVELKSKFTLSKEEEKLLNAKATGIDAQVNKPAKKGSGKLTRENLIKKEIKKLVASTRKQVQVVKDDAEKEMRSSDNEIVRGRADKFHNQEIRETIGKDYSASLGFGGIVWIPGNIHEGPSSRISKGNPGFDANRDDGGSEFEESAKHLIPGAQFLLLEELSKNLSEFGENDKAAFDLKRIDQFIDLLLRINEIREKYPNMKQFDVSEWEQVKFNGERQYAGSVNSANTGVNKKGFNKAGIIPKV